MEFEVVRQNSNLWLARSIWLLTPRVSHVGSNGLQHRNLPPELYQNTESDGTRRGPPKSEPVADDLYLASDANVSCAVLNRLKHRDPRLEL